MAAAAILNLLLLFILVKYSVSGRSRLHCCKISFIYVNRRPSYCWLCKNPRWRRPSWILFLFKIFAYLQCRTSSVIHVPNFAQICAIINKLWAIN